MNWNKPGNAVNRTGFVIALAAVMAGTAWAGQKLEREQRHTVRVDGHTIVSVSNPRGKTVIVGREGATEVVVVATKIAKAGNAEKTEELLARLHYEVREENGKIIVRTVTEGLDKGHNVWSLLRGDRQLACVDYAIEVPHDFSVESLTTSGDVRVTNVAGPVVITATSGAIALREIDKEVTVILTSGTVEAKDLGGDLGVTASSGDVVVEDIGGSFVMQATSGDVRVHRVSGNAEILLVSGDFELTGCLGDVTFRTSSGDAEIHDVEGSINAVTSSGDIDVMILPVHGREFLLSSSSGDIGVLFLTPEDYGFLLDVSTNSGSIDGDMVIKVDKISRQELKGVVGSGACRVMIETASGDVSIIEKTNGKKTKKETKKQ